MRRENPTVDFEVDVLDQEAVGLHLNQQLGELLNATTGTIVQWDDCRTFPASRDPAVTMAFVDAKVATLRNYLGLTFHRLLALNTVTLTIDVYDSERGEAGLAFQIIPIDPFHYSKSGAATYPKTLSARVAAGGDVNLRCHIWPSGADTPSFRLYGKPVDSFQGFYLYRNNRLLMAGGWGGVTQESKSLKLARVAVDIEEHPDLFSISMEKSGVQLVADLVHAIELSLAKDGTSFLHYLDDASEAFKTSNRRTRRRTPILPPGQGLHPWVKRTIEREVPLLEGEEPIRIRWRVLFGDDFIAIDRTARILWINSRYRSSILRGTNAGVNDAPLLKTLLFLIYEDLFRGQGVGAKDKENLQFWNEVLTSAALAEEAQGG